MRASLSEKKVDFVERDFFKDRYTELELRQLIGSYPVSEVFSNRSPSFKKLNIELDSLTEDDMVKLMLEEPRLIKRPLIRYGDQLIIGNKKTEIDELIKS